MSNQTALSIVNVHFCKFTNNITSKSTEKCYEKFQFQQISNKNELQCKYKVIPQ